MENNEKKNHSLIDLMDASMSKIREMVDSNTIIGEPIQTPDGVTLIPVSRLSLGVPAVTTAARMVEMVPEVMDRVERFIDKRKEEKESF